MSSMLVLSMQPSGWVTRKYMLEINIEIVTSVAVTGVLLRPMGQ